MDARAALSGVLGVAYQRNIMGKPGPDPHAEFARCAANPDFIAAAKAELQRCRAVEKQCFSSKANADFLRAALARLTGATTQ